MYNKDNIKQQANHQNFCVTGKHTVITITYLPTKNDCQTLTESGNMSNIISHSVCKSKNSKTRGFCFPFFQVAGFLEAHPSRTGGFSFVGT